MKHIAAGLIAALVLGTQLTAAQADEPRAINSAEDLALLAKLRAEADAKRAAAPPSPPSGSAYGFKNSIQEEIALRQHDIIIDDLARKGLR